MTKEILEEEQFWCAPLALVGLACCHRCCLVCIKDQLLLKHLSWLKPPYALWPCGVLVFKERNTTEKGWQREHEEEKIPLYEVSTVLDLPCVGRGKGCVSLHLSLGDTESCWEVGFRERRCVCEAERISRALQIMESQNRELWRHWLCGYLSLKREERENLLLPPKSQSQPPF